MNKLILALAILTLTTTPALARGGGGGFHGGGGGGFQGGEFHGGGEGGFHGGEFHGGTTDSRPLRPLRPLSPLRSLRPLPPLRLLRRLRIRGACRWLRGRSLLLGSLLVPVAVPGLHLRATSRDSAGAPGVRAATVLTCDLDLLVLLRRHQGVLPLYPTVPGRVAQGGPSPGRLTTPMFSRVVSATPSPGSHGFRLNSCQKGSYAHAYNLADCPHPRHRD